MTPCMCKKVVVFDLDDTLYKEIDFLRSGYRKVAKYVGRQIGVPANDIYYNLLSWYSKKENAFEKLNEYYDLNGSISGYLEIYRFHQPNITLSEETKKTLNTLKEASVLMGIITDGRKETQRNKIEALGLEMWIPSEMVIINDDKKYFKPNHWSFDRMMLKCFEKYPDNDFDFYYLGDNIEKDFMAPNELGWETICILDDGRNIHKQDFTWEEIKLPKKTVSNIDKLIQFL